MTIDGADNVPGEVWRWMRREIEETDGVGQAWADKILGGAGMGGEGQTYTIVLRGDDSELGRGRRWTPVRTYKETRDRRRAGESEPRMGRQAVHMRARHGWRLQHRLEAMGGGMHAGGGEDGTEDGDGR